MQCELCQNDLRERQPCSYPMRIGPRSFAAACTDNQTGLNMLLPPGATSNAGIVPLTRRPS